MQILFDNPQYFIIQHLSSPVGARLKEFYYFIYIATVWWPRIQYKTSSSQQKATENCLGITGAMVLTVTPKVLLGLPRLHPKMESEAQAGIYELSCNQQWKLKSIWYGMYQSWGMRKRTILQMGLIHNKPFTVIFHDSTEGENGFQSGTQSSRQWRYLCCSVWTWYKNFTLNLGSRVHYSQH